MVGLYECGASHVGIVCAVVGSGHMGFGDGKVVGAHCGACLCAGWFDVGRLVVVYGLVVW